MKKYLLILAFFLLSIFIPAQVSKTSYKSFDIHIGDTINRIDKNGLKQGRWIYYGKDKRGWTSRLFNSKQIVEDGFYINDKKTKTWKTYHHTNKLKSEITYIDGVAKGTARFFNTDGKIMLEGDIQNKNFTGEYYIYDENGNKIKKNASSANLNGYLDFKGYVTRSLGKNVEGVKVIIERNDFEIAELTTDANGGFNYKLDLNFEYILKFTKPGFNSQSLLINAYTNNIYDTTIYHLEDWKVVMYDNIATAATTELFGFLLNKPSGKIYFSKRKKKFVADGSYVHLFKKEVSGISETTKLMLAKAADDNKKLEIENLRIESEKKAKEIELLTQTQQLKEAEIKAREAEILAQKIEAENKANDAKDQAALLAKEKQIKELQYEQQQEKMRLQEIEAAQKDKEFERLALVRKMQELELRTKDTQLNKASSDLDEEKKQKELASKGLEMANREKKLKDAELKQNMLYIYFMIGVLGVVAVFSFFLVRNIQQKKKANFLLAKQAHEIEEKSKIIELKNEETEQSIQYAKRIQFAILPPTDEIDEYLKNYFILYKPKDIVSGDFYFFSDHYADKENKTGEIIIAAVDCTGHGVPGAFMSMVGNEKLKDAVDTFSEPSKILSNLNAGIKQALRQGGDAGTKDGMDICLCTFPAFMNGASTAEIKYAAANRPLWIIRNNATEVEEIKATKQSIGGHTDVNQVFAQHSVTLNKGDTIYLFSDGYADQFGGPNKKKIMTKKFKEILISIQNKNMAQQNKYLTDFMDDWCKDTEQIDDILVIGIKV
ncbi:MAG: SpoIIE family protein phosphatase [Bacteroidota bacterium]|nr:SpoIIE family protein phosphatase [Bacteroidota bacterium]